MKILHTADWHLGKRLDHVSRLPEQKEVLDEICEIAEKEAVDAVLIAGDLFDHINPSIEAIELLYKTCKRLSRNGLCPVIGIAGNHDSPDRIEAPVPLAQECGIILTGYPDSEIRPFELDSGLKSLRLDKGFVELKLPNQSYPLRLILTPYANELRLRKYLGNEDKETQLREVLAEKWQSLGNQYCDPDGVNLLMTHLFIVNKEGERPEESEDEKSILTVGNSQEVFAQNLPESIQYVALGHLHRRQSVQGQAYPVMYSGSPLAYSMSEAGQQKFVQLIEIEPGQAAKLESVELHAGKPLVRKQFQSVENAIEWLLEQEECWIELSLETENYLSAAERKRLMEAHSGILNIVPILKESDNFESTGPKIDLAKNIESLFQDYFAHKTGQEPNEDLKEIFKEIQSRK